MPRRCTVCDHPQRHLIETALVSGDSFRNISERYGTSVGALHRHREAHVGPLLRKVQAERKAEGVELAVQAEAVEVGERARALDVMEELRRCFDRLNLLSDACDRWLRDADDPTRYDLGPRADDVVVTYMDRFADGSMRPRKAPLARLLLMLEGAGVKAEHVEMRHADVRDLLLKTMGQLKGQVELLAKLLGYVVERPEVAVVVAEWERRAAAFDWEGFQRQFLALGERRSGGDLEGEKADVNR